MVTAWNIFLTTVTDEPCNLILDICVYVYSTTLHYTTDKHTHTSINKSYRFNASET